MFKNFKKITSVFVLFMMLFSIMPFAAFAATIDDGNLVVNGGFEDGIDNWRPVQDYTKDAENIYSGNHSAELDGSIYLDLSQHIDFKSGKTYIASLMAKSPSSYSREV